MAVNRLVFKPKEESGLQVLKFAYYPLKQIIYFVEGDLPQGGKEDGCSFRVDTEEGITAFKSFVAMLPLDRYKVSKRGSKGKTLKEVISEFLMESAPADEVKEEADLDPSYSEGEVAPVW